MSKTDIPEKQKDEEEIYIRRNSYNNHSTLYQTLKPRREWGDIVKKQNKKITTRTKNNEMNTSPRIHYPPRLLEKW